MTAPRLVARSLVKRLGGARVLDGASIEARAGECLVVAGANGAGKSTLLRTLATVEPLDAGELVIDGVDARADGVAARGRLAHVGHAPGLHPALTAVENVEVALAMHGRPRGAARDALAAWGLARRADDRAARLSRGEAQRTALARAFACATPLVLLDEPWTGLDASGLAALDEAVAAALARGAAVVACAPERATLPKARHVALRGGRVEASA